ncbi:MAG: TSCPD domain-containing protein, partial [Deltaproteobacteria bacterium]|nr:TSCPD domain-containing protein [Deltaproteobacteria bacterium]
SGVKPDMIVKQLKGISCHLPAWAGNGAKIMSCADAVAKAVEWYVDNVNRMFPAHGVPGEPPPSAGREDVSRQVRALGSEGFVISRGACPDCGSQVEMQEGCLKCRSCGFSEC